MGGRSGTSGGIDGTIAGANKIKKEMLAAGLNSKFKGVQRMAREGTGNYSYKDNKAVGKAEALKMEIYKTQEWHGYTLVEGVLNNKEVFYAAKDTNETIQKIKKKLADEKKKQVEESRPRKPDIRTTSTYDRWKKRHDKIFAEYQKRNRGI